MNTAPFFSILVPTRNRPNLAGDAIQSVLCQTFHNYELIISNNGPDPDTQRLGQELSARDSRVKYLEYSDLSMPEHWECATATLSGLYILILTDRSLLFCDSLQVIYDAISQRDQPDVVSWRFSQYLDNCSILLNDSRRASAALPSLQTLDSYRLFLDEITGVNQTWSECLPRGLNSAVKRRYLEELRSTYGTVFRPISPDFTFASFCLLNTQNLLFIDKPLFITRAMDVSNGGLSSSGESNPSYVESLGKNFKWFANVPCSVSFVINSIYEDFFNVAKLCGREDLLAHFDRTAYYSALMRELKAKVAFGRVKTDRLFQFYVAITQSASRDSRVQQGVLCSFDQLRPPLLSRAKLYFVRLIEARFPHTLNLFRRIIILSKGHGKYVPTAVAASRFHSGRS